MKTLLTSIGILLGFFFITNSLRYEVKIKPYENKDLDTLINYTIPIKQMKVDNLKSELSLLYKEINYKIHQDETK